MPEVDAAVPAPRGGGQKRSGVPHDVDAQLLAGVQMDLRAEAVPRQQLRHAALEELGDLRDGIAGAHGVDHAPGSASSGCMPFMRARVFTSMPLRRAIDQRVSPPRTTRTWGRRAW